MLKAEEAYQKSKVKKKEERDLDEIHVERIILASGFPVSVLILTWPISHLFPVCASHSF